MVGVLEGVTTGSHVVGTVEGEGEATTIMGVGEGGTTTSLTGGTSCLNQLLWMDELLNLNCIVVIV